MNRDNQDMDMWAYERFQNAVDLKLREAGIADFVDVDIGAAEPGVDNPNVFQLDEVTAEPVGQGYGSRALAIVTELADAWEARLDARLPDEEPENEDEPSLADIENWLAKNGFAVNGDTAVREPQPAPALQT